MEDEIRLTKDVDGSHRIEIVVTRKTMVEMSAKRWHGLNDSLQAIQEAIFPAPEED